jgi:hypothetical protein
MGAAVDGCGGGGRVMDRDAHMDRQWVCDVYSQLDGFSDAQNAEQLSSTSDQGGTRSAGRSLLIPSGRTYS